MVGRDVIDLGLHRMYKLLALLEDPQNAMFQQNPNLKLVHVTGTNGKGSVCEMVRAGMLGKRVGMFTSPFLMEESDSIKICSLEGINKCISNRELASLKVRVSSLLPEATSFEVLVASALVYFASMALDVLVIEVGMGGLRDATNVFHCKSIFHCKRISVITSISFDHEVFLGNTLEAICTEKCGIFANSTIAIVNAAIPCMHVVQNASTITNSKLCIVDSEADNPPLNGEHQPRLMQIAVQVCVECGAESQKGTYAENIRSHTHLPGRLERRTDFPTLPLILDGAHNAESATALLQFVTKQQNVERIIWIMATSQGREEVLVSTLIRNGDTCIATAFPNDGWIKSVSTESLAARMRQIADIVSEQPNVERAVQSLLAHPPSQDSLVVVAGSLYLVREYLRFVQHARSDTCQHL